MEVTMVVPPKKRITRNFSPEDIARRTERILRVRVKREFEAHRKDQIVKFMLSQAIDGFTSSELANWGIFKSTFLQSSLRRLVRTGQVRAIKLQRRKYRYYLN